MLDRKETISNAVAKYRYPDTMLFVDFADLPLKGNLLISRNTSLHMQNIGIETVSVK